MSRAPRELDWKLWRDVFVSSLAGAALREASSSVQMAYVEDAAYIADEAVIQVHPDGCECGLCCVVSAIQPEDTQ